MTEPKRRRRTAAEKEFTLAVKRDAGERIAALIAEAPVRAFFDDTQKHLVSQITAAAGGDGEGLRIAGLRLQVFLQFKQALIAATSEGQAAREKLARLKTDD